jgi:hypothetical protein
LTWGAGSASCALTNACWKLPFGAPAASVPSIGTPGAACLIADTYAAKSVRYCDGSLSYWE